MARLLKRPARFNDSASFEEIAEAINVVISVPNPKKPKKGRPPKESAVINRKYFSAHTNHR